MGVLLLKFFFTLINNFHDDCSVITSIPRFLKTWKFSSSFACSLTSGSFHDAGQFESIPRCGTCIHKVLRYGYLARHEVEAIKVRTRRSWIRLETRTTSGISGDNKYWYLSTLT